MSTNPKDTAFPLVEPLGGTSGAVNEGLTKREWFAGMALVGLMASQDWSVIVKMDDIAADAVNTADHLINALNAKDLNA